MRKNEHPCRTAQREAVCASVGEDVENLDFLHLSLCSHHERQVWEANSCNNSNFVERMGRGPLELAVAIAEIDSDSQGYRHSQKTGEDVKIIFLSPCKVF